jgi:hypothetical protein
MSLVEIKIDNNFEGLDIKNPTDKFAKLITDQFRTKLGIAVTYEIMGDIVNIFLEKKDEKKRNIPYKIINGRIIVPSEFQKYLSKDGKSLTNMNGESDYGKVMDDLNLNIFN